MYNAALCPRGKPPSIFAPPPPCWLLRWARRATTPGLPRIIKRSPPPPEFNLGARVFDGAVADLAARGANGDLDFQQWLAARRLQIIQNAEHAFAGALSHRAMQLPFVKRARVDLQTSLGGRKGAGGVDVAGALRETDDDIVGWQLRAYAGEDSAKGLNSGVFYRRIVNGALAGVNVFADYEDGDDGDFWRWSIGGDVKNRFGELSANHYFAITDAQVVGGKTAYTREGYDVDVAARIPRLEWAKARVGYYNFKGEFGDADEDGLRAGLDLSPGEGVVFGVEYDGEDGSFGGNISYTHTFGETQQESQRAGDFNPRAHFYDAVRREYSQRISRTEGGGNALVIVGTGASVQVRSIDTATTATATVGVTANIVNSSVFPLVGEVIVNKVAGGEATMMQQGGAWHLTLSSAAAEVAFLGGTVMSVASGMGSFNRNGGNLTLIRMGGAVITLIGTRFDFEVIAGNPPNANITLHEGGLAMAAAAANVNVEVSDGNGAFVNAYDNNGDLAAPVGCAGTLALSNGNVSAKCNISRGMTVSVASNGRVSEGAAETLVGRFETAGGAGSADGITATTETPGFTVGKVGDGFNLSIEMTTAARANPEVINANMIVSGEGHPATTIVFPVFVNPSDIEIGFADDDAKTTFSRTGAGNVIVGTLTVGGGYQADGIAIAGQSANGGFALQNASVLIITSEAPARTALVTVRGDDNNRNTPPADLPVTVTVFEELRFAPANLLAVAQRGMVTAHIAKTLGTIGAAGGFGNYAFAAVGDGATLVDMSVMVLSLTTGVTTTLHYTVNDRNADNTDNTAPASLTEPLTFFVTVTAINPLVISANVDVRYLFGVLQARASVHRQLRLTLDMAMTAAPPPRMITLTVNLAQKIATDNDIETSDAYYHIFEPGVFENARPEGNPLTYTISVYESNVMTIRGGG